MRTRPGDLKRAVAYLRASSMRMLEPDRKGLDLRLATLGREHPDVATAHVTVGSALRKLGQLDRARTHFSRAIAIWTKSHGPNHSAVAVALNNLGNLDYEEGNLAGARDHYLRALDIKTAVLGPEHLGLSTSLYNIGEVYREENNCAQALEHYNRSLALRRKHLGPEHIDLAFPLTGLGECYVTLGRWREAHLALTEALRIRESAGGDRALLAQTRFALARAMEPRDRGRAIALARAALSEAAATDTEQERSIARWLRQHGARP